MNSKEESVSLGILKKKMVEFTKEMYWDQFHSLRNLLLALVGEVRELSEIFQWRGEERCQRSFRIGKRRRSST